MKIAVPKLEGLVILEGGRVVRVVPYPDRRRILSELVLGRVPEELRAMAEAEGAELRMSHAALEGRPSRGARDDYLGAVEEALKASFPRDAVLIQMVGLLQDLTQFENILEERLRELLVPFFPTSEPDEALRRLEGSELPPEDREILIRIRDLLRDASRTREAVKEFIEDEVKKRYPNLSAVATPYVAALLITKAGGLERLARMPASTIQVLGAERSLMLHLTKGRRPPKHGILYQHPWVFSARRKDRGRIARALAAKIAIAARLDLAGKDRSEELLEDLRRRLEKHLPTLREAGEAD